MLKKTARIISDIFIPPTYTLSIFVIYIFRFELPAHYFYDLIVTILFAVVIPISFFVYLRKKKLVVDNDATIKEERNFPYLVGILINIVALLISYLFGSHNLIIYLWAIYGINTFILMIVNYFWKISAHAMGAAALSGALFFIDITFGLISLIFVVLTGFSRIVLRVHTPMQVFSGALIGFFLVYLQLMLFTNILV